MSTFQTTSPITHHHLPISVRSAREIANLTEYGLDLNPPYQRGSVWTTEQRIALVRSWLAGVPVPAVTINDRSRNGRGLTEGEPMFAVIDGKQRIETAIAWFSGELAVPASWFPAGDVLTTMDTEDGPYVTYTGLSKAMQLDLAINRAKLPMIETNVPTIADEAALYVLLERSGTPQTAEDVERALSVAAHPNHP